MITVYTLKPGFQRLLCPVARSLLAARVTPNHVTASTCALSVAFAGCLVLFRERHWLFFLIPPFFFTRMALNAVDGVMARVGNLRTRTGTILNELGDVISDAALYSALGWCAPVPGFIVGAFVWLAAMSEMAGVVALQVGASRRFDGPMGKSDRVVLMSVFAVFEGVGGSHPGLFKALLGLGILGLAVTVLNRARGALRATDNR